MAKKHTPWYIEFREVDFDDKPIPNSWIRWPSHKAVFAMCSVREWCQANDIWFKQQSINISKREVPTIHRLYFQTESERNAALIVR